MQAMNFKGKKRRNPNFLNPAFSLFISPSFRNTYPGRNTMIVRYRYWNPFAEMEALRRQMDAMFNDAVQPRPQTTWTPAAEWMDDRDRMILRVMLPGVKSEDLDVQVTQNTVSLSGAVNRTAAEHQRQIGSEFRYGSFRRVFNLPVDIQPDQVEAELKDGVLTLTLPKADTPRVVKLDLTALTAPAAAALQEAEAADQPADASAPESTEAASTETASPEATPTEADEIAAEMTADQPEAQLNSEPAAMDDDETSDVWADEPEAAAV
jgi:HSP20 family protein